MLIGFRTENHIEASSANSDCIYGDTYMSAAAARESPNVYSAANLRQEAETNQYQVGDLNLQ